VAAHAITSEAIVRCVEAGVRTIEHANLIDAPTAELCAEAGVYVVPTMVIYQRMVEAADEIGLNQMAVEKSAVVLAGAHEALAHLREAGTKVGFGTDMVFSPWDDYLFDEIKLRREVFSPLEILQQATSVNAEILGLTGKLGVVAPGAFGDLLIVDGDPLIDPSLLSEADRLMVIQGGALIR
jgi:imidazolonepropionase-like amidohydrolase